MKKLVVIAAIGLLAALLGVPQAMAAPAAPAGVTAIALDGKVELGWQPVAGATGYAVYRGPSAGAITTQLTPPGGVAGTTYADTSAANGTTYFYAVRAIDGSGESTSSLAVRAKPASRACTTGNDVVVENCFPGSTGWEVTSAGTVPAGGIEGFATATSVNRGESVGVKVNTGNGSTFRVEVYRTGYYGGTGARLISTILDVPGTLQPACATDGTTGLLDCAGWSTSFTLTTTSSWTSGMYLLRLVREDTGADNHVLLVVRDDARHSELLYGAAFTNYQAYNNYGGRSLYDFNSSGSITVAGTPRAVKVSFDRPFEQPRSGLRDWYTRTDFALVKWLEREGYDVAYQSDNDMERNGARVRDHETYVMPAHDEYYSANMRSALQAARDAGVNIFNSGANQVYWKIRFENSPVSGAQDRVQVTYKSTQSGGPDPSGIPTGTWRDPAGANNPENALLGVMYIGDNDNLYFPLVVSASEGTDRVFRNTGLDAQAPGSSVTLGSGLVGWEWDARVANGFEPAGVKTLASSPVTGGLVQGAGSGQVQGSATIHSVKYTAPSGALVFSAATNHWSRGLERNGENVGEPNVVIQQITTNVLQDMGAVPQTPAGDIELDNPAGRPDAPTGVTATALGPDSIRIDWTAVAGASGYNVYRLSVPRQGGVPLGVLASGSAVTGTTFTDTSLSSGTPYYYVVTTVAAGTQSLASNEAAATTQNAAGQPIRIDAGGDEDYTSTSGAVFRADTNVTGGTVHSINQAVTGTSDSGLYQSERYGSFAYAIPVAAGKYTVRLHFAEIYYGTGAPGGAGDRVFSIDVGDTAASPDVSNLDVFAEVGPRAALVREITNVTVTDGTLNVTGIPGPADDPSIAAIEVIPVPDPTPQVTSRTPAPGATGVARTTTVTATFSVAMNASTLGASSFTLTGPGTTPVAATVAYDGPSRTATLAPNAPLAYSTTYTARLTTAVQASDGTPLASPVTWTFTTQSAPAAPTVTSTAPTSGATGISRLAAPRAVFSRAMNPATLTSSTATLRRTSTGATVTASVSYDAATNTVTITPTSQLLALTGYTAQITTGAVAADGVPLASPVSWSFTTALSSPSAPTVTARTPAVGATNVARNTTVTATFSRTMDAATITTSTVTLTGPGGAVPATIAYNATTRVATLTPSALLAYGTTYTATLTTGIRASDQTPLASAVTWTFTTVPPPPPPTVTATSPVDDAPYVARSAAITFTFSRSMDPASLTTSSVQLTTTEGAPITATVDYDDPSRTVTLTPTGLLAGGGDYVARVTSDAKAADGIALAAAVVRSFSTASCPCNLLSSVSVPAAVDVSTQDGRTGAGPWSLELGVEVRVDQDMVVNAIRFYKSPSETGPHVGRIWTASGVELAQATFASESGSGWQQQTLAAPVTLTAGVTYVVSVNANSRYVLTSGGLASQVVAGPIRSVVGGNGVYADAAGVFPAQSYNSSNYFIDLEAMPPGDPVPPGVTATAPASAATGVARTAAVTATFTRPIKPSTLTATSFTLSGPGGPVAATVTYDDATSTATLVPIAPLAYSATYTATLTTAVKAQDGMRMSAPAIWSFTVADPIRPTVVSTVPVDGGADVGPSAVLRATFSRDVDGATVTPGTFTLTGPGGAVSGAVSYDAETRMATFAPASALATGTYTARLGAAIEATDDAPLGTDHTWTFTVVTGLPPATVTSWTPADGASLVARSAPVTVTFSRSMDPASITSATITLEPVGGLPVAATVGYDAETRTATIDPDGLLASGAAYVARVTTGALAADGSPLAAADEITFTTALCPCRLFSDVAVPAATGLSTRDDRPGFGPFTYELGVKVRVDQDSELTAIRFYKSPGETGTHVGKVWSASGALLGQVTFATETGSGWQVQSLGAPIPLAASTTYVVSVNAESAFVVTGGGLATQVVSGPLRSVADGQNGVFGLSAGTFPTLSYNSSNYFVDLEVVPAGSVAPPGVTATSPTDGAADVSLTSTVTATFTRAIQPATVTGSSFTLTGPGGAVPAAVAYDDQTSTATLVPAAPLAHATTYTARLTTAVTSTDGMTLPAPIAWTFTTTAGIAPQVVDLLPADGTADVGPAAIVRASFDRELAAGTVDISTVTLTGPGGPVSGAVAYAAGQRTATLVPDAPLAPGSYTARLDGAITAADGAPLQNARTWTFAVVAAPPALAVAPVAPAAGATGISRTTPIQVSFNRSIDPSTLTASSFRLRAPSGALVAGTIAYEVSTLVATLTPAATLDPDAVYTVEVSTDVLAADLSPLPALASWTFTTTACPCRLMDALAPNATSLSTSDGRGSGTFTYEMGTRIQVTAPAQLTAIRFYKSPGETGTHVATLWSSTGAVLAQATFADETPAGWQSVALETPVALTPGTTYTVSVGLNELFVMTTGGLAAQRASGALQSVVGGNGVFGLAAGSYPTLSYNDSNYFVDAEIG